MTSFLKTVARIAAPRRNDEFDFTNKNNGVHRRTGDPRLDLALAERP